MVIIEKIMVCEKSLPTAIFLIENNSKIKCLFRKKKTCWFQLSSKNKCITISSSTVTYFISAILFQVP